MWTPGCAHASAANLAEVVKLSQNNSTFSPFDSDALQFFTAHVYALDIGAGDVCIGDVKNAVAPPTTTPAPAATPKPDNKPASAPTPATTADNSCHTHADGGESCRYIQSNAQPSTVRATRLPRPPLPTPIPARSATRTRMDVSWGGSRR